MPLVDTSIVNASEFKDLDLPFASAWWRTSFVSSYEPPSSKVSVCSPISDASQIYPVGFASRIYLVFPLELVASTFTSSEREIAKGREFASL